jgi:hypothetical protein
MKEKAQTKPKKYSHGFVSVTYGLRLDPEVLTKELIARVENNDIDPEELYALGAETTHFEGLAWKE